MSDDKKQEVAKINPIKQFEQAVAVAKGVKDIVKIDVVKNRYVAHVQAISGRSDGLQMYEQESFAFIELANSKPEIMECDPFSIVAGFLRAASFGLSFQGKQLSVYPRNVKMKDGNFKKMLVVDPEAHGKRRMLESMPTIKEVEEGVIIFKDDKVKYDAKNKKIISHEQVWPQPEATEATVIGAYCTIKFTDGSVKDVLVNQSELKKARNASKMADGGQLWITYYGQACKKTTYNRAFSFYYEKPKSDAMFHYDVPEETIDTAAEDVTEQVDRTVIEQATPDPSATVENFHKNVNENTGEIYHPEEVKEQPKKERPKRDPII